MSLITLYNSPRNSICEKATIVQPTVAPNETNGILVTWLAPRLDELLLTPKGFLVVVITIFVGLSTYILATIIYNLSYHPLSRFHGPKLWAATRVPYVISMHRGTLVHRVQHFHAKYGSTVRIAPNELSFTDPTALYDIYGHHKGGTENFPKNPVWMSQNAKVRSILSAGDDDHHRIRHLLSHSFSETALREQEPILQHYVDNLMGRLRQQLQAGWGDTVVDLVEWFNWTTFDIIGDLGFGESFNCLTNAHYHPWASRVSSHFKAASLLTSFRFFPFLESLVRTLKPSALHERQTHFRQSKHKIHRRMNLRTKKADLMSYVLSNNDKHSAASMTVPEIEATFIVMIIAGSETTASALSATTSYLLAYPCILARLVREIRSSHSDESSITLATVMRLPYLTAVLEEFLRMAPPVPGGLPRVVPSAGATVCGHHLPAGTNVSFHQLAAYHSPSNFAQPDTFIPERWLPATEEGAPFATDVKRAVKPFSFGHRDCIGKNLAYAEMRLILSRLLWNFDVGLPEGQEGSLDWSRQLTFVLWEKQPLRVKLTPTI